MLLDITMATIGILGVWAVYLGYSALECAIELSKKLKDE